MLSMFRSTPLLFLLLSRFVVVLQVCNSFLCAPRVIAAAFSYTDDYKAAPDPSNSSTNVWQYFYGVDIENRDGNYTRLGIYDPSHQERAFQGWVPTLGGFPFAGKNTSPDNQYGIEPGEGYLHTSNDGLGLAVAFQAPSNGVYTLSGYLRAAGGGSVRWFLDNGARSETLNSGVLLGGERRNFHHVGIPLSAGERVYLILDSYGSYNSDSTGVGFYVDPTTLSVEIALRPVVTVITGTPGRTYRVEYLDALAPAFEWKQLTNVVLTGPTQSVLDGTPQPVGQRFYRAVEVP
jgi:hypothetical protein